jgi:hypothetical protein
MMTAGVLSQLQVLLACLPALLLAGTSWPKLQHMLERLLQYQLPKQG